MHKVIECVPNFSEGRDKKVIEAIAAAIRTSPGVSLLDVDAGASTNRTVYTFVGEPDAVVDAAINAARVAKDLIDMTRHSGEHPRLGAMDVCPLVPVRGVEVEECIYCAARLAERLAKELGAPIYLYGEAARSGAHRRTVPQIRAGEYESLPEKLKKPEWQPDFGPANFVPSWGASMVGVRPFLLAYNINILGTKEQAHRLALNIREQGRGPNEPGRLRAVQGMGWWLEEAGLAQVSLNITNQRVTPLHVAFNEVTRDAEQLGVAVAGSELVGLVPLDALLDVANFYIQKEKLLILEESQKVRLAVSRLGLSSLSPFIPEERVIEYRLQKRETPLLEMTTRKLIEAVGSRSPAPGGGSVSALIGSLGAALATMCGLMTYGRKQWDSVEQEIRQVLPVTHKAMFDISPLIDEDSEAFNEYMIAGKLPRSTPEESAARDRALNAALERAVQVPLRLITLVNEIWPAAQRLASVCNLQTASDLQVAVRCLEASVWGASYNVQINLRSFSDPDRRSAISTQSNSAVQTAQKNAALVLDMLDQRLQKS